MSLKKMDRHFCGGVNATSAYQLMYTLVNIDGYPWVQGSGWRRKMRLYAHLYPIKLVLGQADAYDTNPNYISNRMLYLCDITWSDSHQQWEGETELGTVTIKMRGASTYGWPSQEYSYDAFTGTSSYINPFNQRTLYGLLYCGGNGPMRLVSSGTYNLIGPAHSISRGEATYDKFIERIVPPQNVGTYTLTYIIHQGVFYVSNSSATFAGYKIVQQVDTVTYDRKSKVQISKVANSTILQDVPPITGVNLFVTTTGFTTFQNRRRYHVTPEEEWFHTSCNPIYATANRTTAKIGVTGFESFEYSGDISPTGTGPTSLTWGVEGVAGGSTFATQVNYDWNIPTSYNGIPIEQPSVSKFVNVRRWIWGNLDITYPRIKIRVTTPEGTSDSAWIGSTPVNIVPPNGTGAGQVWPGDDKQPDYAGQGAPGRVPDLAIYSNLTNLTNCFPDSGLTPANESIGISFNPPSDKLLLGQLNPDLLEGYTFEVIDDSKADGLTWQVNKLTDPVSTHSEDLFTRKGWLSSNYKLFRWPGSLEVTLSGLTTIQGVDYSWMNGTYNMKIVDPSPIASNVWASNNYNIKYGRNYFNVGPNTVVRASFLYSRNTPTIYLRRNGQYDPLSGSKTGTVLGWTGVGDGSKEFCFLKTNTMQLFYYNPQGLVTLIPGTTMTVTPIS